MPGVIATNVSHAMDCGTDQPKIAVLLRDMFHGDGDTINVDCGPLGSIGVHFPQACAGRPGNTELLYKLTAGRPAEPVRDFQCLEISSSRAR